MQTPAKSWLLVFGAISAALAGVLWIALAPGSGGASGIEASARRTVEVEAASPSVLAAPAVQSVKPMPPKRQVADGADQRRAHQVVGFRARYGELDARELMIAQIRLKQRISTATLTATWDLQRAPRFAARALKPVDPDRRTRAGLDPARLDPEMFPEVHALLAEEAWLEEHFKSKIAAGGWESLEGIQWDELGSDSPLR
ncbi:MAG: hypothetical protein GY711_17160 [bacterium]|nr:hypothetical protein [bacterium]